MNVKAKNSKIILSLGYIILCAGSIKCKQESEVIGSKYLPLLTGNQWDFIFYDVHGDTERSTVKINSVYKVSDTVKEYAGTIGSLPFYITTAPDRITLTAMNPDGPVLVSGFLLFPLPLEKQKIGTEWTALTEPTVCKGKIIARDDADISAGYFKDCVRIDFTNVPFTDQNYLIVWLAPNVGVIKLEAMSPEGARRVAYELTSYVVK